MPSVKTSKASSGEASTTKELLIGSTWSFDHATGSGGPARGVGDQVGQLGHALQVGPAVEQVLDVPAVAHVGLPAALLARGGGLGHGLRGEHLASNSAVN